MRDQERAGDTGCGFSDRRHVVRSGWDVGEQCLPTRTEGAGRLERGETRR